MLLSSSQSLWEFVQITFARATQRGMRLKLYTLIFKYTFYIVVVHLLSLPCHLKVTRAYNVLLLGNVEIGVCCCITADIYSFFLEKFSTNQMNFIHLTDIDRMSVQQKNYKLSSKFFKCHLLSHICIFR